MALDRSLSTRNSSRYQNDDISCAREAIENSVSTSQNFGRHPNVSGTDPDCFEAASALRSAALQPPDFLGLLQQRNPHRRHRHLLPGSPQRQKRPDIPIWLSNLHHWRGEERADGDGKEERGGLHDGGLRWG
jgi:hypothetical protein